MNIGIIALDIICGLIFVASILPQIHTNDEANELKAITTTTTTTESPDELSSSTTQPPVEMTLDNDELGWELLGINETTINDLRQSVTQEEEQEINEADRGESRSTEGELTGVLPYLVAIFTQKLNKNMNARFVGVAVMINKGKMAIHSDVLGLANDHNGNSHTDQIAVMSPAPGSIDVTADLSSTLVSLSGKDCKDSLCVINTRTVNEPQQPFPEPNELPTLSTSGNELNDDCYLYTWTERPYSVKGSKNTKKFVRMPIERTTRDCSLGVCELAIKKDASGLICGREDLGAPIVCQGKLSYLVQRISGDCARTFNGFKVSSLPNQYRRSMPGGSNVARLTARSRLKSRTSPARGGQRQVTPTGRRPPARLAGPSRSRQPAGRKRQPPPARLG